MFSMLSHVDSENLHHSRRNNAPRNPSPPKRQSAPPLAAGTHRPRPRRQRVHANRAKEFSSTCMPASFASTQFESELRRFGNLEGYVRSAAQCCGLRACGPHISRIERRRGSLAAMGKARDGWVWRRGCCAALHENRWRDRGKQASEVWLGSRARRLCGGEARQRRRWRRGSARRVLETRRLAETQRLKRERLRGS